MGKSYRDKDKFIMKLEGAGKVVKQQKKVPKKLNYTETKKLFNSWGLKEVD